VREDSASTVLAMAGVGEIGADADVELGMIEAS
jgi:hypothetical protein